MEMAKGRDIMLFQKEKIEVIAGHRGCLGAFPSEHLLLAVRGSCGRLSMDWFEPEKEARGCEADYRSILYLGETPLLRIQANGSPTCESMLAAGYGIPEDCREIRSVRAALDKPYAGLADALERVRPVLGLLQPGIYVLSYSDYYPTDGDGHFFWDVPESLTSFKATSEYYDSDKHRVLPCFPCYLYPAQSAQKYDPQQAENYRRRLRAGEALPPVLAYSLWGYMSVLLDGHHRACACALEEKTVPALTISRPGRIWREGILHIVWPDGSETPAADIITPAQQKLFDCPLGRKRRGTPPLIASGVRPVWDMEYIKAAQRYPMYADAGALALYPGVELNAEGLRCLAMDDDHEDPDSAARLLRYAARQPGADAKDLAMAFIEPGYPDVLRQSAFEVLDRMKDDPEIDELMISVLVNCEREDDPVYRIANGYWDSLDGE